MEASAAAPDLRPLGIGEILDVAIKIYLRNALVLFGLVVVVVLPVQVLTALVRYSADTGLLERIPTAEHLGEAGRDGHACIVARGQIASQQMRESVGYG